MFRKFLLASLLLMSMTLSAQDKDVCGIEVKLEKEAYTITDTIIVKTELILAEGWHINSCSPGDEMLIPTAVKISPKEVFSVIKNVYPRAKKLKTDFSAQPIAVYENGAVFSTIVTFQKDLKAGSYNMRVTLEYQACNGETCQAPAEIEKEFEVNLK